MKVVTLVSGGIDSPVATWIMMKKGFDTVSIHFDNRPFTDKKNEERAMEVMRRLNIHRPYIVPHGHVLAAILKNCPRRLTCVICRRMMYRVAERIARKEKAKAIVTGEALGQHASQTLANIYVEDSASQIPIVRPLISYDKEEIIHIARKIGTFGESIKPAMCCNAVPVRPRTRANIGEVLFAEDNLDIESLVKESVRKAKR